MSHVGNQASAPTRGSGYTSQKKPLNPDVLNTLHGPNAAKIRAARENSTSHSAFSATTTTKSDAPKKTT